MTRWHYARLLRANWEDARELGHLGSGDGLCADSGVLGSED